MLAATQLSPQEKSHVVLAEGQPHGATEVWIRALEVKWIHDTWRDDVLSISEKRTPMNS